MTRPAASPTSPAADRARVLLRLKRQLEAEQRKQRKRAKVRRGPRRKGRPPFQKPARRGAYWERLGRPPECGPADHAAARTFCRQIAAVREMGGWSKAERVNLSKLAKKWRRRAAGEDPRFELAGNVRGRLPEELETTIREIRRAD